MAEFLEKTWFVWWTFAALVILRWFHVISSSRDPEGELQGGERDGSGSSQLSSSRS